MEGHGVDDKAISSRIIAVKLCREFGWTFKEYRDQPWWFINDCIEVISTENKYSNHIAEKAAKRK